VGGGAHRRGGGARSRSACGRRDGDAGLPRWRARRLAGSARPVRSGAGDRRRQCLYPRNLRVLRAPADRRPRACRGACGQGVGAGTGARFVALDRRCLRGLSQRSRCDGAGDRPRGHARPFRGFRAGQLAARGRVARARRHWAGVARNGGGLAVLCAGGRRGGFQASLRSAGGPRIRRRRERGDGAVFRCPQCQ
jgi:hypothetical protein